MPANKPEPPPVPPEEIIRRFAAKEDEMLRASQGYGFQKSVRLEEIGPDNKASGQMEIVTQQFVGPDGRRYEKPVRRTASTLQHLQVERGDSDLIASTPLFPLTTPQLPKYEITFQGKQPLDELNAYIFAVKPRARGPRARLLLGRGVGGRTGYGHRENHRQVGYGNGRCHVSHAAVLRF